MSDRGFGVVRYRLRRTFARRWPSYLVITLMVGLLGGLAMGSLAAARRTQSSFSTFLASTKPSTLTIAAFPTGTVGFGSVGGYSPALTRLVADLPEVRRATNAFEPFALPLDRRGRPQTAALSNLTILASNGLYFTMDRPGVVEGRMAKENDPNEFVTTAPGAAFLHWRVGEVVPFGFYTVQQISSPDFGSVGLRPALEVRAKLVGLVEFSANVVQDQVDRYPTFAVFPPALARRLLGAGLSFATYYGIQTDHGPADLPTVERAWADRAPKNIEYQIHLTTSVETRTDSAIRPESIALGVFGVIAALAALTIGAQAVARHLRSGRRDLEVLRELGAGPVTAAADALVGALAAVLLGALLAFAIAVALSPIGPIGPVRPVYPDRGVAVDWTVLGSGVAIMILVLALLALGVTYRLMPRNDQKVVARHSSLATFVAATGLPPPAVAGVRFALDAGDDRSAVPVRAALLSTALAVTVVVTSLTFASGLSTLVSHPALYGWNWSYALFSESGPDVPPAAVAQLSREPQVAAYSYASSVDPSIDGRVVPALVERAGASVVPPIVTGHAPLSNHEIVLGAVTMAQLGVHVGDTVTATYGSPRDAPLYVPPVRLKVVGTATFPAIGFPSSEGDHTSMGIGALIPSGIVAPSFRKALQSPDPVLNGPEFVLVRMRAGVNAEAGRAEMRRVALVGNRAFATAPNGDGTGDSVLVFSDLLPAEIVNYRSTGATPGLLAAALAAGAAVALGLTLVASVRRRRRDLALLKALGFTGEQVMASVVVQSSVLGLIGLLIGIPAGIATGRWLWTLFAHQIGAVPQATVPAWALVVVGAVTFVLVNAVAVLPGRAASRTPTAAVLRAE